MKIIVLIKQVPDIEKNIKITVDEKSYSINRQGIPSIMNPPDKNALEEALRFKDELGCEVTAITMGPPQANDILKEAISMGADSSFLITDRIFAGSDTLSTTLILSKAIRQLGDFDYIFAGKQALDGDTGQVGPGVACRFSIPQILSVKRVITRQKDSMKLIRNFNGFEETIVVAPKALLTFCRHSNIPRLPSLRGLFATKNFTAPIFNNQMIQIPEGQIGIDGSPTRVIKTFKPSMDKTVKKIQDLKGDGMMNQINAIIAEVR